MDLLNLILIMVFTLIVIQFWRLRGIAEHMVNYANQYCDKNGLQYMSLARTTTKFTVYKGRFDWQLQYQLEFSSDGQYDYTGNIVCHGKHIIQMDMPAYRVDSAE